EVFFGKIPLMLDNGSFIFNGAERVIVSQLHRSPGLFLNKEMKGNKERHSARLIPYDGSWIEIFIREKKNKDIMYISIDRKRKIHISTFLRALGYETDDQIFNLFCEEYKVPTDKFGTKFYQEMTLAQDIKDEEGDLIAEKGEKITKKNVEIILDLYDEISIYVEKRKIDIEDGKEEGLRKYIRNTIIAEKAQTQLDEKIGKKGNRFRREEFNKCKEQGVKDGISFYVVKEGNQDIIANTVRTDNYKDTEKALARIYGILRPGSPATVDLAEDLIYDLFFNPNTYNLGEVGRYKLNNVLGKETDEITKQDLTLTNEDLIRSISEVLKLRWEIIEPGDIDHLGNRRVRSVGELLQNHLKIGFYRMKRVIQERMNITEEDKVNPQTLVNSRPVTAIINEFFGSHQLSQYMDQTNILSEITNKRRLSALGPGGLSRERAGFEARDVHYTHYGRICPIETPEGQNIGLITSLASFGSKNRYGFLQTPYQLVEDGKVKDEYEYLDADKEEGKIIAQAKVKLDKNNKFVEDRILARRSGEFIMAKPEDIDYIDISTKQLVSVAAGLIPFLEHDDVSRALMGSNMQRQAVPLVNPQSPIVGTGIEKKLAKDSGYIQVAQRAGTVEKVTANLIVVKVDEDDIDLDNMAADFGENMGRDIYYLEKFRRSNNATCITTRPIVSVGDKVEEGDPLTEGFGTQGGEAAFGQNLLVAFLPWRGYNYEDAIVLSERLVKDNVFDSIHIEELEVEARETKLGREEITRDIPQVMDEMLKDLDENGIIRVGSYVEPGDILVGKVTPKGKSELTPEEKLLRAIFGKIAEDVKDASLRVPPGVRGKVIDVKVFTRKQTEDMEDVIRKERKDDIERIEREQSLRRELVEKRKKELLEHLLVGEKLTKDINMIGPKGTKLKKEDIEMKKIDKLLMEKKALSAKKLKKLKELNETIEEKRREIIKWREQQWKKLLQGDELQPGVIKAVKVYIANKKTIAVGDKMAGRHGNKGVVSTLLPEEDMPYLEDGRPVDVILNPLGVPSRMNVGQILETHLGWAAKKLGYKIATPVFDGATEEQIREWLEKAKLPKDGKTNLYDGYTGEEFDEEVVVGYIYMMKLHHLVDDKLHARATGPYSLVSQQPLGGKAQFGGQRFGEMEVWALEAYGAAHMLREMLTVKSDDVEGRTKMYEAIIRDQTPAEPGIPESFNVLVNELKGLCLNIDFLKEEN
ncbi:MAG: DNA-directed RNA polymerase subunit beta, partial [Candidatus Mcinerneyibacterium aminivorans]